MEINENQNNKTTSKTKPINQMTDQELAEFLQNTRNQDNALLALREANFRKDKVLNELTKANADLTKRLALLEEKTLKKSGRKRQTFYFNFQELTDDLLLHLIDTMHMTISELEKDVNAGKNQLRNRYNKAKKKQQLERQVKKNDNT